MRSISLFLLLSLFLGACSSSEDGKSKAGPLCQALLKCAAATQPDLLAGLQVSYGSDSDCWKIEGMAASCEKNCRDQIVSFGEDDPACDVLSADASVVPLVDGGPDTRPWRVAQGVDLLVVLDTSGSMTEERRMLGEQLGALIGALQGGDAEPPSLRIGFVTPDLGATYTSLPNCEEVDGDNGALQTGQLGRLDCPTLGATYLQYEGGASNVQNCQLPGERDCVEKALACMSKIDAEGCGFEHTLEAARRALDPAKNINPGFLRPDALLAVLFVTDEDDCSAANGTLFDPAQQNLTGPLGPLTSFRCFEFGIRCDINDRSVMGPRQDCVPDYDWLHSIQEYVSFFEQLKGGMDRVVMAAIAGPTSPVAVEKDGDFPMLAPSCSSMSTSAAPAIRINALVDAFGGTFGSICESFTPTLQAFGQEIRRRQAN